jgi:hypothetical protein
MKHKKYWVTGAVVGLVAISSPAVAAELSNAEGQTCEHIGVWHFVNNQTGGATEPGTLTATFSDGGNWTVTASKVNKSMQHFYVESDGAGELLSASTNLPGRLVLSDYTCEDIKK